MIKPHSIPKARTRIITNSPAGRERLEYLQFQEKYKQKKSQFLKDISKEAQNLQDIEDSKTTIKNKVLEAIKKEHFISKEVQALKTQVQVQAETIVKQSEVSTEIASRTQKELDEKNKQVQTAKKHLESLNQQIKETEPIIRELKGYLEKEKDARVKFLTAKKDLDLALVVCEKTVSETNKEQKSIEQEKKELDEFKTYVAGLYGKLASYVSVAKETLNYVNEELKKSKVPIHFIIPNIELTIDNFNEYERF